MSGAAPFPWVRALAFVGLTALMAAGPVLNQVLGLKYSRYLKPWRMYFGHGVALCEVVYVQRAPDGTERVLDRYDLLGYRRWTEAPEDLRNLPDGPTIGRVGQQLCDAVPGRRPDVRARARCASIRGWQEAFEGRRNLCRLGPRQVAGLRPRERHR